MRADGDVRAGGRGRAGKTLAENLASLPGLKAGQEVILPLETPIKATGHLQARRVFLHVYRNFHLLLRAAPYSTAVLTMGTAPANTSSGHGRNCVMHVL